MTSVREGRPEVAAIEIHLSGRDDELDRDVLGAHPDRLNEIVGAVARMSLVPVFAKLPGACDDIVGLARTAVRAGATGVTLLASPPALGLRSEEHTSELQSHSDLVCRLLLEKKKNKKPNKYARYT